MRKLRLATATASGRRRSRSRPSWTARRPPRSAPARRSSTRLAAIAPPTTVGDLIATLPGVSQNGQNGLFQTYSIRGVSRQRVMSLVEGVRVTSERRAGVSVSWIDPLLIGSVEVVRGPATTFYGSGALGGTIQLFPTNSRETRFDAGFETIDSQFWQAFGTGGDSWSLAVAHRSAGDAETPDGDKLNSNFGQTSLVFRKTWGTPGGRQPVYDLLVLPSFGNDIGKANAETRDRQTDYPLERHQVVRFRARWGEAREASAWVHHHDLETQVVDRDDDELSRVFNDTVDFGARYRDRLTLNEIWSVRLGADWFARRGVDARELTFDLGQPGTPQSEPELRTIDNAREDELGVFARAGRSPRHDQLGVRRPLLLRPADQRGLRVQGGHRRQRLRRRDGRHRRPLAGARQRVDGAALPDDLRALLQWYDGLRRPDRKPRPVAGAFARDRGVGALPDRPPVGQRRPVPHRRRRLRRAHRDPGRSAHPPVPEPAERHDPGRGVPGPDAGDRHVPADVRRPRDRGSLRRRRRAGRHPTGRAVRRLQRKTRRHQLRRPLRLPATTRTTRGRARS